MTKTLVLVIVCLLQALCASADSEAALGEEAWLITLSCLVGGENGLDL